LPEVEPGEDVGVSVQDDQDEQPVEPPIERWTPERRRARTRSALVDAARFVFARKGFEGASLDEIAETAGYTRGAIYKHFRGKEDLLFAVYDELNDQALERYASLLQTDRSHALDPAVIVDVWQELFGADTDLRALELEFQLYSLRHPEVRERWVEHGRRNRELVAEFMRANAAHGDFEFALPIEHLSTMLLITSDAFRREVDADPTASDLYREFLQHFLPAVVRER
jgi:AcrR family transcriptional regulator